MKDKQTTTLVKFLNSIKRAAFVLPAMLAGCAGIPSGVQPVRDFDLSRYLGTWYEIARLDHRFERGLTNVSATYSLRDGGGINVVNRGYDERAGRWREARGRAHLVGASTTGHLKVSFFWPFYGSYVVMALDREWYGYALICGPSRSYLWILARDRALAQPVLDKLVARASDLGFNTAELIFVEHDRPDEQNL
jgi:apolipoprotein D and lipocalin family protein